MALGIVPEEDPLGPPPMQGPSAVPTPTAPVQDVGPAGYPASTVPTAFEPLPPPPAPPALTGDHEKDVQNNVNYQRALTDYHTQLTGRQGQLNEHAAKIQAGQSAAELEQERATQKRLDEENERYGIERGNRQQEIDRAVAERGAAAKDLEGFNWHKPLTGGRLFAAIAGGIGASLQNYGASQQGHQGNAENEALKTIDLEMQRDYEQKRERLKNASSAVMEARYGFKDAADNHRAALNDLDAERAAKYRMIAAEAASQLRQMGVPKAQIDTNAIVVDSLQKAAQAEGAIHEREEGLAAQREKAKGELAIANANLGIARGNLSLHRLAEADAHADREASIAARAGLQRENEDIKKNNQLKGYLKDWDRDASLPKAAAARDKLLGVKEELDDPNATPATIASAIMEFDTAKRQGTATGQSYNALASHLAPGLMNKIQAAAAHGTGTFTETEKKNLRAAVDSAMKVSDEEGKRLHDSYMSRFYGDSKLVGDKEQLGAESESRFGRWGFESDATRARKAANAPAAEPSPTQRKPTLTPTQTAAQAMRAAAAAGPAQPGKPTRDQVNAAYQIMNDPKSPADAKASATQILVDAGEV